MSLKAGNGRTQIVGSNAAGICVTDSAAEERTLDDAVNLLAKLDVTAILREVQDLPTSAASKQPSRLKIDLTGLSAAPPGYKHFHAWLSDASGCLPAFHQKLFNAFDQDGLSRYSEPPRLRVTILDTFRLRLKLLVKGHEAADESLLRTLQTNRSYGAATNASQIASNITKREHENVTLAAEQDKLDYTSTSNSSSGRHLWGNGIVRSILRPLIAHMADFQWGRNLEVNRIAICKSDPRSVYDAEGNLVDMVLDEVAVRSLDGD